MPILSRRIGTLLDQGVGLASEVVEDRSFLEEGGFTAEQIGSPKQARRMVRQVQRRQAGKMSDEEKALEKERLLEMRQRDIIARRARQASGLASTLFSSQTSMSPLGMSLV